MKKFLAVCAAIGMAAWCEAQAVAQMSYNFINIADTNGPFAGFYVPDINADGTVAFEGKLDTGVGGIFTGAGGVTTTIADDSGELSSLQRPSINDAGTVAFTANFDAGGVGVFTGDGGPLLTVADATGPFSAIGHGASINAAGDVALVARLDAEPGVTAIFKVAGESVTKIADNQTDASGRRFVLFSFPQINDAGNVAFDAALSFRPGGNDNGVYSGNGNSLITILESAGAVRLSSLNDDGTVLFYRNPGPTGVQGSLHTGTGGPTTLVADSSGALNGVGYDSDINNGGGVVFAGGLDNGKLGIYTGANPALNKVIETGDPLFGSLFVQYESSPRLNDNGDVVFGYLLSNGVRGIAVASVVPEPAGTAMLACFACMAWLAGRRVRSLSID